MQQDLLTRYDQSEQAIVAEIAQKLDDNQLTLTQNLLSALESNQFSEPDMSGMLAILEEKIVMLPSSQQKSLYKIIKNPQFNAKHKLKITIPIVPLLCKYEAEYELNAGLDIKSVWENIKNQLRRN